MQQSFHANRFVAGPLAGPGNYGRTGAFDARSRTTSSDHKWPVRVRLFARKMQRPFELAHYTPRKLFPLMASGAFHR